MPEIFSNDATYSVMFYQHEIDFYRQIGERRYKMMRHAKVVDRLIAKNVDVVQNELLGLLGEAAVAELLGTEVRTAMNGYEGDGGISDMEVAETTVQVKTSWHRFGGLLFMNRWKFKADVGVLAVTNKKLDGLVMLPGWTTREEFREIAADRLINDRPCAYLDQNRLRPIHTLTEYLGRQNRKFS